MISPRPKMWAKPRREESFRGGVVISEDGGGVLEAPVSKEWDRPQGPTHILLDTEDPAKLARYTFADSERVSINPRMAGGTGGSEERRPRRQRAVRLAAGTRIPKVNCTC